MSIPKCPACDGTGEHSFCEGQGCWDCEGLGNCTVCCGCGNDMRYHPNNPNRPREDHRQAVLNHVRQRLNDRERVD